MQSSPPPMKSRIRHCLVQRVVQVERFHGPQHPVSRHDMIVRYWLLQCCRVSVGRWFIVWQQWRQLMTPGSGPSVSHALGSRPRPPDTPAGFTRTCNQPIDCTCDLGRCRSHVPLCRVQSNTRVVVAAARHVLSVLSNKEQRDIRIRYSTKSMLFLSILGLDELRIECWADSTWTEYNVILWYDVYLITKSERMTKSLKKTPYFHCVRWWWEVDKAKLDDALYRMGERGSLGQRIFITHNYYLINVYITFYINLY